MKMLHSMMITFALVASPTLVEAKDRDAPLPLEQREVIQIYDVPGFNKEQIHAGAKRWIAENFKSAEAVIEYDDKDTGTIIGNGVLNVNPPPKKGISYYSVYRGRVGFKMKVEAKDNKMRVSFTNVLLLVPARNYGGLSFPPADVMPKREHDMDNVREQLLKFGPEIIASLQAAKSDDW